MKAPLLILMKRYAHTFSQTISRTAVILIFTLAALLYSEERKTRVVVMDLFGQNINEAGLNELTTVLEKELVKTGMFDTTSRSGIDDILREYGVTKKECTTVPWLVRIGKKLGVEKVVTGSVVDRGTLVTAHIRTVDVKKQEIDKSATVVCRLCSIDDFYIHKMRRIARILAGLEENEQVDDSLFIFHAGPLIKLDKGAKNADIQTKMGDKLFDGMWEMKSRRNSGVGVFLFGLGNLLLLTHHILWTGERPGLAERIGIASADAVIAFLSIPFFLRAERFGAGLPFVGVDSSYDKSVLKGFTLGMSVAKIDPLSYGPVIHYRARPGLELGGHFLFDLNNFIDLQTGLSYVQKRVGADGDYPDNEKLTMHSLRIPVLVMGKLPLKGPVTPHIVLGASPSFMMRARESRIDNTNQAQVNDNDRINRFDVGLIYGLRCQRKMNKGRMLFELKTVEGLLDIGVWSGEETEQKTRIYSFCIGYCF